MRTSPNSERSKDYDSASEESVLDPRSHEDDDRLYTQLLLHAGGHCLALLFGLLIYGVWTLLEDYRDALIWALLCSLPLRNCKDWLVQHASSQLLQDKTLLSIAVDVLCLPLHLLKASGHDIWEFVGRWRKYAFQYEEEFRERAREAKMAEEPAVAVGEPETRAKLQDPRLTELQGQAPVKATVPRRKRQAKPRRKQQPARFAAFLGGLVEIGHLGFKAWRSEKGPRTSLLQHKAPDRALSHSLLRGLLVACICYQAFSWIHSSWRSTVHLLLLVGTAAASISALPFLYLSAHLYLSLSAPEGFAAAEETDPSRGAKAAAEHDTDHSKEGGGGIRKPKVPVKSRSKLQHIHQAYRSADAQARGLILGCIHSLVAAFLVVSLLAGAFLLVVFLSVRIGQESRDTVVAARDAAQAWTSTSETYNAVAMRQTPWRKWLLEQQASVGEMVEQSLPEAAAWAEDQVATLVQVHNLTQVVDEMKALYSMMVPMRSCSDSQKQGFLIALALASEDVDETSIRFQRLAAQLQDVKQQLQSALAEWEGQQKSRSKTILTDGSKPILAQKAVILLSRRLSNLEDEYGTAHRLMDEAIGRAQRSERDVDACRSLQQAQPSEQRNVVQLLGQQLQNAYTHLWRLQVQAGLADLKVFWQNVGQLGTHLLGSGAAAEEVGAMQRLGHAAADPLISISRNLAGVLASSTYSMTALAFSGGLEVLKFGFGLLRIGVRMVVFLALLFYLLAAETDPLLALPRLLPLSSAASQRASTAFSSAVSGVIVCTIQLSAFHALFTWLSFSVFSVHLVYISTVASAVFACLPFIPSWLVSLPAAGQLALLQDRPIDAALLLALHFAAWYIADDLILREIPSSHPYLTGLGVFGGLATFSNPLLGAILGPMALSILSVLYDLHMASQQLPPAHPLSSRLAHSTSSGRGHLAANEAATP